MEVFGDVQDLGPTLSKDTVVVVNFSGRGDKDVGTVMKQFKY